MRPRFSIRDLLWLTVLAVFVVAVAKFKGVFSSGGYELRILAQGKTQFKNCAAAITQNQNAPYRISPNSNPLRSPTGKPDYLSVGENDGGGLEDELLRCNTSSECLGAAQPPRSTSCRSDSNMLKRSAQLPNGRLPPSTIFRSRPNGCLHA
jgi:hypothetical protein